MDNGRRTCIKRRLLWLYIQRMTSVGSQILELDSSVLMYAANCLPRTMPAMDKLHICIPNALGLLQTLEASLWH